MSARNRVSAMKFTPIASASALLGRTRRQRYEQVPGNDEIQDEEGRVSNEEEERERDENRALLHTKLWTLQIRKHKKFTIAVALLIFVMVGGALGSLFYKHLPDTQCDTVRHGYICSPEISQYWGQYSPYFSVPSEIPLELPSTCRLTFAQVLSRHGARDPTWGKTIRYKELINRIHNQTTSYSKPFKFLKDFKYELGSDQLSPFGQQEMINAGAQFYARYAALTKETTPFIRASGQQRVVESAQNWTQGFHLARLDDETSTIPEEFPYDMLIVPESPTFNNTLDFTLCTNFLKGDYGQAAQAVFASVFAPSITKRLNHGLPGAKLSDTDTISLMDLCPFATVASPTGQVSQFCNLFTIEDWKNYDYYQSVGKHYGFTFPNPLGPSQGVGYVNELIARLTGRKVRDHTSTNQTLDADNTTFPIYEGGKGVYADFSHDNDMTTIFSALGLYNATKLDLPKDRRVERDGAELGDYSAAYTVPFGGRMFVEKMVCGSNIDDGDDDDDEDDEDREEFVRIIVNDRVLPLKTCGGDELGRCTLDAFVESLGFARGGGRWEQCFEKTASVTEIAKGKHAAKIMEGGE